MMKDYSQYSKEFKNIPRTIRKDEISMKGVKENIKKRLMRVVNGYKENYK